jgi:photosystem II stability/assembly factor-like uncharacterized protein
MPKGLWKSSDAGKSWEVIYQTAEYEQAIARAYFLDRKFGWIETRKGWSKSDDGGHSWSSFETPLSSPNKLWDVQFIDPETGWIGGATLRTPTREETKMGIPRGLLDDITKKILTPIIYRTNDGGKTWRVQATPGDWGYVRHIRFIDSDVGIALTDHDAIRTHNGGATWTKVNDPRACLNDEERGLYEGKPSSAYTLDSSFAWIAFDDGRMLRTTANDGQTWLEIRPCDQSRPVVIHFSSMNRGHGLGSDGFLYETTDGGKQWVKIGADKYESLSFLGNEHLWLVSERGLFRVKVDQ